MAAIPFVNIDEHSG